MPNERRPAQVGQALSTTAKLSHDSTKIGHDSTAAQIVAEFPDYNACVEIQLEFSLRRALKSGDFRLARKCSACGGWRFVSHDRAHLQPCQVSCDAGAFAQVVS